MPLQGEDYYRAIEQALLAKGEAAGVLSSPTGLGRARESLVDEGLRPHLPGRVAIERGELVDSTGRRSGEADMILVDTHRGRIQIGGESLVPVEASTATLEVKTDLGGHNLEDAVRKIARIKRLTRGPHHGIYSSSSALPNPRTPVPPTQTLCGIVGFRAPSWKTVLGKLGENPEWHDRDIMAVGPDRIVILGEGVAAKNDFTLLHGNPGTENRAFLKESGLSGLRVLVNDVQELLDRYGNLTYPAY
jgi:hypothetical protein